MAFEVSQSPAGQTSLVKEITELARKSQALEFKDIGGVPVVFLPGSKDPASLELFLDRPVRKRARVTLLEAAAFIAYLLGQKQATTLIFATATEEGGSFLAIIDYHEVNPAQDVGASMSPARWGEHRATLQLRPTPEWSRWIEKSEEMLNQTDFAQFLEDNAQDVVVPADIPTAPNAVQMIEIALTLQAKTDVQFASAIRMDNGQHRLNYAETIDAKAGTDGSLKIPERFYLALPPFIGTSRYQVCARLRYRLERGKVTFRYELERTHKIVEAAFSDIRKEIEAKTELKVLIGTVEAVNAR